MNTKKINQALINIAFITLFIIALILPAFAILKTWSIAGIGSLIFLAAYWFLFDLVKELNYK